MIPELPLFLYDGACGFCRYWVERWRAGACGKGVRFAPYQEFPLSSLGLKEEFCEREAYLLKDGRAYRGARAILELLAPVSVVMRCLLWLYTRWEFASLLSEAFYSFVAAHRPLFSRLTYLLSGKDPTPPAYTHTLSLLLRGLGFIYLAAFLSFWVQFPGLIGEGGIFPLQEHLSYLRSRGVGFWEYPTLFWLSPSASMVHLLCAGGSLVAVLLLLGLFHPLLFFLEYLLYLSLVLGGGFWMSFQWDHLLLEMGFLSLLLTSPRLGVYPSSWGIFLLRWLLFRLLFLSGMVKLLSHDPSWRSLTALLYHFETQPLPNPLSPWVHALPQGILKLSCLLMFLWELLLPWGIFAPRRVRLLTGILEIAFQCLIVATGNYGYFNFLTMILCLCTWEDQYLPRFLTRTRPVPTPPGRIWARIVAGLGLLLFLLTLLLTLRTLRVQPPFLESLRPLVQPLLAFRPVSTYGLFAVMTRERYEVILSGSWDGREWKEYRFRYKPDDPTKPLPLLPFHMPRMDWQLWFAALGQCEGNPWVYRLQLLLLKNAPAVLALFSQNPFPDAPPRIVKSELYLYRLLPPGKGTPVWQREYRRLYCPPVRRYDSRN